MAEALTYDSLITDVLAYTERNNSAFAAQIPRFIMLAENKLATTVRGLGYLDIVTGFLTINNGTLVKPARWRETSSFSIVTPTGRKYLVPRTYEFCRAYAPSPAVYSEPKYYADYGYEHFFIAGIPDSAYAFELAYFQRPEPLDATNQTSWTTQYAPQLLLYATLLEAQPYLKNPERTAEFKQLYDEAAQLVSGESTRRQVDHTTLRSPE